MAKKKQQNLVRTDYLENWIGFYNAHGLNWKADALCKVSMDIGAPIDVDEIDKWEAIHKPKQLKLFAGHDKPVSTPV